ncbi:MAG TPA: OmpH family outer membrane protein [Longimicrobiales bacterium]
MRTIHTMLLAAAAVVAGVSPAAAQGAPKWGYIDSRRILAEAPGTKEAQQAFEKEMEGFRGELQKLEQEIGALIADYEKQQSVLAAQEKQARETAIRQKQQEFQQRAMQLDQQAQKRQQELMGPIMERIQKVIQEIREQGGYAFIFDVASGAVIAADTTLDLTDQVLARLNSTASN